MWPKNADQDQTFEPAQCPVCNAALGRRDKSTIYQAHCKECKATFWWKPWVKKPTVLLDKDNHTKGPRRYCGPGGCVCRD